MRARSRVSAHAGNAETLDRAMLNAEAVVKAWGVKLGRPSYGVPKRRTMWLIKMRVQGPYGRIDGYEAIRYARMYGVPIHKYDEPDIEDERDDLTPDEASAVASDRGPQLVYVNAMRGYAIETRRNRRWTRAGLGDPRANFFGDEETAEEAIEELRRLGPDWLARPYRIVAVFVKNRRGKVVPATAARHVDLYTAYINAGKDGVKTFEALDDSTAVERARKWADGRDKSVKARVYRLRVMRQWHESDTYLDTPEGGQYRLAVERGDIDPEDAIAIYDRDVNIVAPQQRLMGRLSGRLPVSARRLK